jgi:hypothetical protein
MIATRWIIAATLLIGTCVIGTSYNYVKLITFRPLVLLIRLYLKLLEEEVVRIRRKFSSPLILQIKLAEF